MEMKKKKKPADKKKKKKKKPAVNQMNKIISGLPKIYILNERKANI